MVDGPRRKRFRRRAESARAAANIEAVTGVPDP